ncbi:hypothetical protein C7121_21485 [Paenibacillus glucanolyticus]|jgi:hypothetical protein|nr:MULTISPECIES: hypothetical protein [Paenibacillus]MCA4751024.1 hypothetical protein [Mycolicibacterium fortuitum]AVV58511.1 hypothetical protein C7121_21485 [Paenibacillus glucanolyticus]ETT40117.1 hypothetical protein C169_08823 [Paenibacillus sp. FSL R5-808]MPY20971.1 hypothetical protein [Paenibacillus glucanolyticus]OMF73242.1 hypothetical protein BK142_18655 [Paenibacillus glucanolyticus]
MGSTAYILMSPTKFTPERLLADSIISAYHSDVMLHFHNSKNYASNGQLLSTTLNINDKNVRENNESFILYVDALDHPQHDFLYYEDVGLDTAHKLVQAGTIEDVYGVEELVFRFIYHYLELNRDDYFWVADYDWVYGWEDLQKLKSLPFDPDWCYKNPIYE